jgi:hypothetical protein
VSRPRTHQTHRIIANHPVSCWYKPAELSKRIAFFYTASLVSGAFGGLLAGGLIEGMEGLGGVRGWKWLFMIEGMATVLIAIGAYFVLPSESRPIV